MDEKMKITYQEVFRVNNSLSLLFRKVIMQMTLNKKKGLEASFKTYT